MLVFALDDPDRGRAGRWSAALAGAGCPAVVAPHASRGSELLCAVIDVSDRDPIEVAADRPPGAAPRRGCGAGGGQPAGGARGAAPLLPRGALRAGGDGARTTASAPEVASWRDLGAFTLLLSVQDDEALRLYCESVLGPIEDGDEEYGGELLRSLEAFIEHNGQWERAAREVYCHRHTLRYRMRKVEELTGRDLSPRPRPDRVLAGAAGAGAGRVKVAVLGAAGTIAPAIVRDLAESEEVESILLLDLRGEIAEQVAAEHGGGKATARSADARSDLPARLDGIDVLVNSASYRVNLDAMRACLEAGCHYLDLGGLYQVTGEQLALHGDFERAGLLAILGIGSSPGKTNLMAARMPLRDARAVGPSAIDVIAAGRDLDPPDGLQRPLCAADADRRADPGAGRPARRRAGRGRAAEDGGEVDFGEPIGVGGDDLHAALGAAHLRRELRLLASASFRLSLAPALLERLRELAGASPGGGARGRRPRPSARRRGRSRSTSSTPATAHGSRRCGRVTPPHAEWGLGGGVVSTAARPPRRCGCSPAARSRSAASLPPERCLDPEEMFAELRTRGCQLRAARSTEAATA